MNRFSETLTKAKIEGSLNDMIDRLNKNDLLILDDFGLQNMDEDTMHSLLVLLDERYDKKLIFFHFAEGVLQIQSDVYQIIIEKN